MSTPLCFKKEEEMLTSLQRSIENTDGMEANTVAYLSSKIQEIRTSLRAKNRSVQNLQKLHGGGDKTKPALKKPASTSLADQKKKEYYF